MHQIVYDGGIFSLIRNCFWKLASTNGRRFMKYKGLLEQGLAEPTNMEIYTCNIDGSDLKQLPRWDKRTGHHITILAARRLYFHRITTVSAAFRSTHL